MMAIIASRPFAISAFKRFVFNSASSVANNGGLQPSSPGARSFLFIADDMSLPSKSVFPVASNQPKSFAEFSTKSAYKKIWAQPASGTLEMAPKPLGMSANFKELPGDRKPGHLKNSGVMYPMVANMLMRPCLTSVARRRLKLSMLPSLDRPKGSQKPTGACTPSSLSNARSGDAVYSDQSPHAEPVRPSWKNMPLIAIVASRQCAISAFKRFFFSSASTVASSGGLQPSSPGARSSFFIADNMSMPSKSVFPDASNQPESLAAYKKTSAPSTG